MNPFVFKYTL